MCAREMSGQVAFFFNHSQTLAIDLRTCAMNSSSGTLAVVVVVVTSPAREPPFPPAANKLGAESGADALSGPLCEQRRREA